MDPRGFETPLDLLEAAESPRPEDNLTILGDITIPWDGSPPMV